MEADNANHEMEQIETDVVDLEIGDKVTVRYTSRRSENELEKTGKVTNKDGIGVWIDAGEEYDDGTPKVLRMANSGTLKSIGRERETTLDYYATAFVHVEIAEEVHDEGVYQYQTDEDREKHTFRAEWWHDGSRCTLHYRDGYVADVPAENLAEQLETDRILVIDETDVELDDEPDDETDDETDDDDDDETDDEPESDDEPEAVATDGGDRNDVCCPECGEQGFDGQGHTTVEGTRMYLRKCWSCATRFAVEDNSPMIPDGGAEPEELLEEASERDGPDVLLSVEYEYTDHNGDTYTGDRLSGDVEPELLIDGVRDLAEAGIERVWKVRTHVAPSLPVVFTIGIDADGTAHNLKRRDGELLLEPATVEPAPLEALEGDN